MAVSLPNMISRCCHILKTKKTPMLEYIAFNFKCLLIKFSFINDDPWVSAPDPIILVNALQFRKLPKLLTRTITGIVAKQSKVASSLPNKLGYSIFLDKRSQRTVKIPCVRFVQILTSPSDCTWICMSASKSANKTLGNLFNNGENLCLRHKPSPWSRATRELNILMKGQFQIIAKLYSYSFFTF